MKSYSSILVLVLVFTCVAESAFAYGGRGGWGRGRGRGWGYRGGGRTTVRCSPEMKQSTVTVAQQVLADAANSKDFTNAARFQEFVRTTSNLAEADEKINSYFSAVGVDSKDATAVAEFVGARDRASYVAAAEKNLDLTPAQADLLVEKFSAAALSVISQ